MTNYNLRVIENAEAKSKREGVKKTAYLDLKIMTDAINYMALVNRHNDEKRVVAEELIYYINGMLKDFRTAMKSRYSKSKNKKAVEGLVSAQQAQQKKCFRKDVEDDEKLLS